MGESHEVWVDPGWPSERRVYRGDDPNAAALSYAQVVANPSRRYEVVWTVDGRTHQREAGD